MFSKILMFFLILNFISDSYGQREKKFFRKDYTYMEAFESFYKIHTIPQNWAGANRMCALENATLWHPDNDDEAYGLLSFWNKTKPTIKWVFVGLSDLVEEGVFVTVEGKSISEVYNNWEPDQPDDEGEGQDCVYMYLKHGPGYLDDDPCSEKVPFICKKRLQSLEWNYQCNMPNLDYTYNKDFSKCYKVHTTPLNWTDAYVVCQSEQSSLAMIKNLSEADYLAALVEITPKPRIRESYQRGIYHLGFHSRLAEKWLTVTGMPFSLDADAWFEHYQPDGNNPDDCGSMLHSGRLINVNCQTKSLFICEYELHRHISQSPFLQPYVGAGM